MKPELPKFPTMLRKMWSGIEVQQWIDENVAPLFEQTAKAVKVPSDEKLPDLFREALSWGRAYGWTISAQQWSEFRDDQVAQLLSRYGQPVSSADTRPDYSEMSRETLEQHASRLAQMLADDKPRQFYVRYALGSASTPSCICCGRTPESVAVQHVEIPAIVVCQKCHDAATKPAASAEPSGYAYRYRHINGGTVLRFNHGEEVNGSKPIEAVPFWFKPQPQQIPEGYKLVPRHLINLCEQFTKWRHCMSYNDSYFGEPEGDLKRIAAEMERAMLEAAPEAKLPVLSEQQRKLQIEDICRAYGVPPSVIDSNDPNH